MNWFDRLTSERCTFCGTALIEQKTYIVRDCGGVGLSAVVGEEPKMYDAVDCPTCGKQAILGERKRVVWKGDEVKDDSDNDNGDHLCDASDDMLDK